VFQKASRLTRAKKQSICENLEWDAGRELTNRGMY